MSTVTERINKSTTSKPAFQYLVVIHPLGLLYGSAGRFLSPENLVGRSGTSFPPSTATLSGIFADRLSHESEKLDNLQLAGPFWADSDRPTNFYVPTPLNCLVKEQKVDWVMDWREDKWQAFDRDKKQWTTPPNDKFASNTWLAIEDWEKIQPDAEEFPEVKTAPWQFLRHLHPRLREDERRVEVEAGDRGSLFLENAVQLDPDTCLIYLSNTEIDSGWYRFGGEGHMVDLQCISLGETAKNLLDRPIKNNFAQITPAVWGSNRFSYRAPQIDRQTEDLLWHGCRVEALLTGRPIQMRYRLGKRSEGHQEYQPKLLSRGRYAVPSGTVYILDRPLDKTWQEWDESWFPHESHSFKRWGCGLALPL